MTIASNYHTVSLASVICKVAESFIKDHLISYLILFVYNCLALCKVDLPVFSSIKCIKWYNISMEK